MNKSAALSRHYDLDFLRVAAMFAVIGIHCLTAIIVKRYPDSDEWLIANTLDSFMRWCVPVFVMISGALLIKSSTFTHAKQFYKKRASRLLLPLFAWPLLYWLWAWLVPGLVIPWQDIGLAWLAGTPLVGAQLYFLFIIAGLYVLAPLISLYMTNVSPKIFRVTAMAALIVASSWLIVEVKLLDRQESYNFLTWCLPYIGYFMLGHSLRHTALSSRQLLYVGLIFIACGLTNSLVSIGTRIDGNMFYQAYLSPTVIGLSISAFIGGKALYNRLRFGWLDRVFTRLSSLSFGVYLLHVMILESIVYYFTLNKAELSTAGWLFVSVAPLSIFAIWLIMKVPGVRRLVD